MPTLVRQEHVLVVKRMEDTMSRNTDYTMGLQYDLDRLLAIDLQPTSQPQYPNRERTPGAVIVCKKREVNVDKKVDSNSLLNPSTGVIFPGAIVKQDHTLAEGRPTPYTLERAPLKLRLELPGLEDGGVITVEKPDYTSVSVAIEKKVNSWLKDNQGYQPPVRAFYNSQKAYTKEQIGISLGFGAQWGTNNVTSSLKSNSDSQETVVYRTFRQIYYTVTAEDPRRPGDVFEEAVVLSQANMPATQPPGFVRSVDYGRIIIVQMTTRDVISEHDAEGALDLFTGNVDISSESKVRYESIAKNSSFQAIVLGGGKESAPLLIGDVKKIGEAIKNGFIFTKETPAYPISYTVSDLKTAMISEMRSTTRYVEVDRRVLPDRVIKMVHRGAYVAKFNVEWMEVDDARSRDADAPVFVPRSWDSGKKTNPWDHSLPFTGDARDIRVTAINDTGLLWDQHREVFRSYPTLDGDKTITIRGTTLNMSIGD